MSASQLRELSASFEVGAHTLHHVDLTTGPEQQAWEEIADSRSWIEDTTGLTCSMFCPPRGRYYSLHLNLIRKAGYLGLRNGELLSLGLPRPSDGLMLMPSTLQAYPHGLCGYIRNLLRRAAFRNLWLYLAHGRSTDWTRLVRSLLGRALERGGVFHLWGHSWEVEQTGQWQQLEEVLRFLGEHTTRATCLTNGQLCQALVPSLLGRCHEPSGTKGPARLAGPTGGEHTS